MFQLFVYVPSDYKEQVKQAVFATGVGKYGNYDSCCWETLGYGQFKPLENSNPSHGEIGKIHKIEEYRIEFTCFDTKSLKKAISAIKITHPYEEVAFGVIQLKKQI